MPSPFPGMDPFIEDREWQDFHVSFSVAMSEALAPSIAPTYVARIMRRVYFESVPIPANTRQSREERREPYVVIREVETQEIVTVIETLSPANKRASSDGRDQYLKEHEVILQSRTNLVELDLLRGGKRVPMRSLPPGDYYAIVSRGNRRPRADVYAWSLRQPLPTISIPLKPGEPEVPLHLQQAFTAVYDRARYHLSLNYAAALAKPLGEADAAWLAQRRAERGDSPRGK